MWQILNLLRQIIYPNKCYECGKKIETGILCETCNRKREDIRVVRTQIYNCEALEGICVLYRYEGGIKKGLHLAKFVPQKAIVSAMAEQLSRVYVKDLFTLKFPLPEKLIVVPIPTDTQRRAWRGYDIPTGIFHHWALQQDYQWCEILKRKISTRPQFGLSKKDRRINVKNCFSLNYTVRGKNVLLVDDIFTSGATMEEAGKLLKAEGAHKVWALAFASGADGY